MATHIKKALKKKPASASMSAKKKAPMVFGIGVPKPLKGASASRAAREAGVVSANGTLKTRFR
jgi:hypothetical protein